MFNFKNRPCLFSLTIVMLCIPSVTALVIAFMHLDSCASKSTPISFMSIPVWLLITAGIDLVHKLLFAAYECFIKDNKTVEIFRSLPASVGIFELTYMWTIVIVKIGWLWLGATMIYSANWFNPIPCDSMVLQFGLFYVFLDCLVVAALCILTICLSIWVLFYLEKDQNSLPFYAQIDQFL
ncbi:hypothetical protein WR25_04024 [Diploscapter pachys]|uniref:G-protein coupled receptors family 1 profile domain-containing protein n=1 Tax=Diploscapter pachys TaxID=2018661 RepID=A0A2A2KLI5_9BILA|nr:hypothetical protein WR25_04024 [Diploscapter pachys]